MAFEKYPYSSFGDLNLDWILEKVREAVETATNTEADQAALREFVETYFANLDVQEEINNKLASMGDDGSLGEIVDPFVISATAEWLASHITPTSPAIDSSLSVSGAGADSKTVGDRAFLTGGVVASESTFTTLYGNDWNNLPVNRIVCIAAYINTAANRPVDNFAGTVLTFSYSNTLHPGDVQMAISGGGKIYVRYYSSSRAWGAWSSMAKAADVTELSGSAITSYTTPLSTAARLSTATGGTGDFNDLPCNLFYFIVGTAATLSSLNQPHIDSYYNGSLITYSSLGDGQNGQTQIFLCSGGVGTRLKIGGSWTRWRYYRYDEETYYVGYDGSGNAMADGTSITALFQQLASDTNKKTIYIGPGEYDIFKEYRDLNLPSPPDDIAVSAYKPWCVFVPANTKLVGLGNVTLRWDPDATVLANPTIATITVGEARTWSPLNIRRAVEIENISIYCTKGRYCVHDDSQNEADDKGVSHIYRNVRMTYKVASGFGQWCALGAGMSTRNRYRFDNCIFEIDQTGNAFYMHNHNDFTTIKNCPDLVVNNCLMIADTEGAIWLQNLTGSQARVDASFYGCSINSRFKVTNSSSTKKQSFNITMVRCTEGVTPTYTGSTTNTLPFKVYD